MTAQYEDPNPRSEWGMVRGSLRELKAELVDNAFAWHPLPPLSARRTSGLPASLRGPARWAPHAVVVFLCLLLLLVEASINSDPYGMVRGLFLVAPLMLALFRPIAAFWLSLAATCVGVLLVVPVWGAWPWSVQGGTAHLVVMLVVAARKPPRVAAHLWGVTAVVGVFLTVVGGNHPSLWMRDTVDFAVGTVAGMAIVSGAALGVLLLVRGWWQSQQRVEQQVEVVREERSRRTVLEERTTIARELHDVVAHHMSVVAIQAEAARYRVEDPPEELVAALGTIRENAVAALTELRRVLGVVRADMPSVPEAPQPTLADLDTLLDGVRAAGLGVRKTTTGAVRALPPGVELSAYRIVQEALSNTLRHAPGAPASVELSYVLSGLGLRVVNEAPDTAPQPSPGAGHGLLGMRERAAMLDGVLTVGPTGDGGWAVEAFLPVPIDPDGEEGVVPGGGGGADARAGDGTDTKELSGSGFPADRTEPAP
ncbi:histidine kinase [Streptomyces sp. 549]|uniref:sensor histidine kinase n=1 Tax=Streptomyces sp. 549 TaxID=3049076 RepID=UPI0024C42B1B|nr:histidine kinase [Streptomyces sp. 549]MDK1473065.1 histidine kinase [Streptomyces sp. 549]